MGPGIPALIFAIPLAIILYLLLIFIGKRWRNRGEQIGHQQSGLSVLGRFFGLYILSFIILIVLTYWNSGSYEKYSGSGDYWRVPIVYPYQLEMIDGFENACLSTWNPDKDVLSCNLDGVSRCKLVDSLFYGRGGTGYFLLNTKSGKIEYFGHKDSLESVLKNYGHQPIYHTIREFYDQYWEKY